MNDKTESSSTPANTKPSGSEPITMTQASEGSAPTPVNTPANPAPIQQAFSQLMQQASKGKKPDANVSQLLAQNPALLSALQSQLGSLVGKSSGYVESLPESVQERLKKLNELQQKQDRADRMMEREIRAIELKFAEMKAPFYKERAEIIEGKTDQSEPKGIPEFWLTALKNAPYFQEEITAQDEAILKHLKDIRCRDVLNAEGDEDLAGFVLEFEFEKNDYFEGTILTKEYYVQLPPVDQFEADEDDEEGPMDEAVFDHAKGCEINWKEGKDVTHKMEVRKQRHKSTKKTRVVKKLVKVPSFFHFFNPPSPENFEGGHNNDDDDEEGEDYDAELEQMMEQDYEAGDFIKTQLIPDALGWFTGEALQNYQDGQDEEDEDDYESGEDEEEDDEEDDEEEGSSSTAQPTQPAPECKQQ
jgi:nucleosome assembly protein 1-like 1